MSIVVLGVNHRSAPLDVIERVAVAEESPKSFMVRMQMCATTSVSFLD
jgi:glutamyl-tRNA reductase